MHDFQRRKRCVLKIGGSSVGSERALRNVQQMVQARHMEEDLILVVSAVRGITDFLLQERERSLKAILTHMRTMHERLVEALLGCEGLSRWRAVQEGHVNVLRQRYPRRYEEEAAWVVQGEQWAASLVSLVLEDAGCPAHPVDARALILARGYPGAVDEKETRHRIRTWAAAWDWTRIPVVTGFLAGQPDGRLTTLGRGGSDYTAALLSAALQVDVLERWTDVPGIFDRDPQRDPAARVLSFLSLEEACRLNEQGLLGMHPHMLRPLVEAGVQVHVRCTHLPEAPGTVIFHDAYATPILP